MEMHYMERHPNLTPRIFTLDGSYSFSSALGDGAWHGSIEQENYYTIYEGKCSQISHGQPK